MTSKSSEKLNKRLTCISVSMKFYSKNTTICKEETPSDLWCLANKQIVGLKCRHRGISVTDWQEISNVGSETYKIMVLQELSFRVCTENIAWNVLKNGMGMLLKMFKGLRK